MKLTIVGIDLAMNVFQVRGIDEHARVLKKEPSPVRTTVNRQFRADACDRLWVADMTYIPTWTGFLYLAVVLERL